MTHNAAAAGPRRALVVDDDYLSRRMLSDSLRSHGFSVVDAESAEAGLRVLTDLEPVDLVVTDLRMPVMDGEELVRAARSMNGDVPRPLLIIVTGDVTSRLELDLQQAGADAVLSKRLGAPLIAAAANMLVSSLAPAPDARSEVGHVAPGACRLPPDRSVAVEP